MEVNNLSTGKNNELNSNDASLIYVSNLKVMMLDFDDAFTSRVSPILSNLKFEGRDVVVYSSKVSENVKKYILDYNNELSIILIRILDINDEKAFSLIRYVRDVLLNDNVRIIAIVGKIDEALEKNLIVNHNINDLREDSEITEQRLFTIILSQLRTFRDIVQLGNNKSGLESIIRSSSSIFELQSLKKFSAGVLRELILVESARCGFCSNICGFAAELVRNNYYITSSTGKYNNFVGKNVMKVLPKKICNDIEIVCSKKKNMYSDNSVILYFFTEMGAENIIYFEGLHDYDKDLIEIFYKNICVAFDNIYLNKEVENTQKEVIFTLGEIAEARSNETGHHVKRVAEYSKLIAEKYGMSAKEVNVLKLASPMHDVGKLAIPDSILNKPGKLTVEEFEIMKTHSIVGYDMLKKSNKRLMKTASIIALEHHEKFNGDGYPYGLSRDEIHICGRITAVADVFDALSSDRVYKKAWTNEDIMAYFKEQRGKHFDPDLVDILFENVTDIFNIKQKFADNII